MQFILASGSSSRKKILKEMGFVPTDYISTNINETPKKGEKPRFLALRLAQEKSVAAIGLLANGGNCCGVTLVPEGAIILTADTVISVGNRIVDKALTDADVEKSMKLLSGRNHVAQSAFCAVKVDGRGNVLAKCSKIGITRVKFKHLSQEDICDLVDSKTGLGAAGGYTIDGVGAGFVISATGACSSNIRGLPNYMVRNALKSLGLRPSFSNLEE